MPRPAKPASPFRYFNSSPEVIRLVVLMYIRFPLSLRNVEDLLFERGIDICHETVRLWWNRFGPLFAGDIRRQRGSRMRSFRHWRWHLNEMYVKLGLTAPAWRMERRRELSQDWSDLLMNGMVRATSLGIEVVLATFRVARLLRSDNLACR
ncbi:MAG TPA: hypothetical protein VEZ48_09820 [Sphingomonadaceae bacterium]|nr:hypothetical protein [Sphingomonadaceae bacterium]